MDINRSINDGFTLHKEEYRIKGMALLSLRIALISFFETYRAMRNNFRLYKSEELKDYIYPPEYYQSYSKCILYFHHFFELVIKDLLRNVDNLLVVDVVKDPILLYKLIKKESIKEEEYEKIFTVEF